MQMEAYRWLTYSGKNQKVTVRLLSVSVYYYVNGNVDGNGEYQRVAMDSGVKVRWHDGSQSPVSRCQANRDFEQFRWYLDSVACAMCCLSGYLVIWLSGYLGIWDWLGGLEVWRGTCGVMMQIMQITDYSTMTM